ncbi:DUF374 domain-containing protein [Yoonia sp. SS1-5]|uniref:Lysophospholipid acyltransferase family protein n=1 Tax=Yoonia rhodophyticola TaxID=3137370 RepID=A0AAN0MGI9_9RHOB
MLKQGGQLLDEGPVLMSLRKRLEKSKTLAWILGFVARCYFGLCYRTTRWDIQGLDALKAALADGPIILVVWHSRLLMGPFHWPVKDGQLSSIHTSSPIGRVVGAMQRQQGLQPFEMREKRSNRATSRQIMKQVKEGTSIGITADGPEGPALIMKDPPIDWARATGRPVFSYAFATQRAKRVDSWDRMLVPLPFTKGSVVFSRFPSEVPRKMDAAQQIALRSEMQAFLLAQTAKADKALGLPAGP